MIRAEALSKRYPDGTLALREVNMTVEPGEIVGLLGPSGAGKTTFLRLLYGALQVSAGRLDVLGYPMSHLSLTNLRHLRRQVAVIPQGAHVIPNLSVLQNVLIGRLGRLSTPRSLLALVRPPREEVGPARKALERVGLDGEWGTRAEKLSGGQQQRVAVARALVQDAQLILADEPVASVDIRTAEIVLDLFQELQRQGKTFLISLHQVDYALAYCSRLLGLNGGCLVYDGPPEGIEHLKIYHGREEETDEDREMPSFGQKLFDPPI